LYEIYDAKRLVGHLLTDADWRTLSRIYDAVSGAQKELRGALTLMLHGRTAVQDVVPLPPQLELSMDLSGRLKDHFRRLEAFYDSKGGTAGARQGLDAVQAVWSILQDDPPNPSFIEGLLSSLTPDHASYFDSLRKALVVAFWDPGPGRP
jgi:hypothetical protein